MKIRNGFVSNSSSCNFTCENCHELYEYGQESGEHEGGLCEECEKYVTFCNVCETLWFKNKMFKTKEIDICRGSGPGQDNAYVSSKHTCPECLAKTPKKLKEWIEIGDYGTWVQTISNPNHKLSDLDAKLSQAIMERMAKMCGL